MRKGDLNAVSLFAGVGGFDLAMGRTGIPVVASVEINAQCREVLAQHFPAVTQFSDIRKVIGDDLRSAGFIPESGILVGGFPCQDVSVAGLRKGFAGERSSLFYEIARLIDETSPKWVVLENVPGLLSSRGGADFAAVLWFLADRGYGVAWRVLDAQYFGVAQRRRRVFIVGCLGDDYDPAEILFESEGVSGGTPKVRGEGAIVTASAGVGFTTSRHAQYVEGVGTFRSWGGDLGGSSETLIAPTLTAHHSRNNVENEVLVAHTLTTEYDASEDGSGRGVPIVPYVKVIRQVLFSEGVRRLLPIECERLQGFPDNFTEGQSDAQRYRQMGNAVTVSVAEWIMKRMPL